MSNSRQNKTGVSGHVRVQQPVDKQKVRGLFERVAAESDPWARMAILDEALAMARSSAPTKV